MALRLPFSTHLHKNVMLQKITLLTCTLFLVLLASCGSDLSGYSIKDEASYQDDALLTTAWQLPAASKYKNDFVYQNNGAFCGPASLINVLNSVGFKHVKQSDVFVNTSIFYIKARLMGLTLDEMKVLMTANLKKNKTKGSVSLHRNLTIEQFRTHLKKSNNENYRYIINFNRFPLFGINIGHHSPLGGYIEGNDMVFVLDVNDNYKPFLVKSDKLYDAMNTTDNETKKKRGLISIHIE